MPGQAPSLSPAPPEPLGRGMLSHWVLDPAVTFLNHGSFGAAPRVVLDAQTALRQAFERHPIEMLERRRPELLARAKQAVGALIGARPDDFGFVTNATGGVNAVLRSLEFRAGDEILTTNHVYNAVKRTIGFVGARAGARNTELRIPLPIRSPQQVTDAVAGALGDRTRLVVIDHITSPTAVVLPVEAIVRLCAARGIDVLVDGAHAPGMIDLDMERIGAAYYSGNLHKWVCAPKGAAFLRVRPDRQRGIHPNIISHFLDEGLAAEFAWQGTRDITAWLTARDAIEFMEGLGWDRVRRHNHQLATWVQSLLTQRWGVEPATPADGSMLGSMATVALPPEAAGRFDDPAALQARLYKEHRIEVPVLDWDGRWWVRASCQVYNNPVQYEHLAEALTELLQP